MTSVPRRLPVVPTSFVGRAADLRALAALISGQRLVTVVGPGGCGKTRLVLELVAQDRAPVRGYVELAGVGTDESLSLVTSSACGVRDEPGVDPAERLLSALEPESGLLILDNCEHLRPQVAVLAGSLLRRCARLRLLATSRVSLGVAGESIFPIAGQIGRAHV